MESGPVTKDLTTTAVLTCSYKLLILVKDVTYMLKPI